jgi:hypothetical protein
MPAWSGLWNGVHGANHTLIGARNNLQMRIAKLFAREGARSDAQIIKALTGAAAGETAAESRKRVVATVATNGYDQGGARAIETVNVINRATTAGDVTAVDAALEQKFAPTTYPVDRSGMGGGGKTNRL